VLASTSPARDDVLDRDVVTTEAPRPGLVTARVAEDPKIVELRITATLAGPAHRPALDVVEHVF
jgi:hypothetical protein